MSNGQGRATETELYSDELNARKGKGISSPPRARRAYRWSAVLADHAVAAAGAQHLAGDVAGDFLRGQKYHGVGHVGGFADPF